MHEWLKQQELNEEDSVFNIDPKLAHKIWEIINEKLEKNRENSENWINDFENEWPTASGFFHFLNEKLKND